MTGLQDDVLAAIPQELRALIEADPQAREVLSRAVDVAGAVLLPTALRGEAAQLLELVGAKLDEADAAERAADLAKSVTGAQAALQAAEAEASRLAEAHRQAVEAERQAADKYTAAQDHARLIAEQVEDLALADADPAEQTEALVKRNAAEQVAGSFRAKAENAAAQRVQAEASLATARDVARKAKVALTAAQRVAENPPPLAPGPQTLMLDGWRRVAFGRTTGWGDAEFGVVAGLVRDLAKLTGAERTIRNDERTRIEQEARERASNAFLPKPGHALRPTNPGTTYAPLPPRVGG